MDKNAIKKYAVWARRELIERVSQRALIYGITAKDAGDPNTDSVNGHLLSQGEKRQRQALIRNIKVKGYEQVMEEVAYTWFNRFAALRFMEVNGYLPSHVRVFTNDAGEFKPQILAEAIHLELDGLDMNKVYELESANKSEELFKYLLIVQCNALNSILPGMFQRIEDYTELLLPDYLLREGSVIEQMVTTIPEEDWTDQVQIIGWLYQYYNTEPKDKVFANLKKNIKISKENIPAATQLFTPDWIVHYMVENSLGRLWLEGHPNDDLKSEWKYYLDEAEQEPEVQAQLAAIRKEYATLKPEKIRVIDPCMGSGHILCVLFDVLVRIYEDYGYTAREAAVKIVEYNLWGLDIDERAAQLSYFAVMMKARQYDRRFFSRKVQPHVYAIEESNGITSAPMHDMGLNLSQEEYAIAVKQAMRLVEEMHDAKEYGSIIHVTPCNWDLLRRFAVPREEEGQLHLALHGEIEVSARLQVLIDIGEVLAQKYHAVVTNPPYLGSGGMSAVLQEYVKKNYPDSKADLFAVFIQKCQSFITINGYLSMITQHSWMFLTSFEGLRKKLLNSSLINMVHLGARAFEEIAGEVVQTTSFVFRKSSEKHYIGTYCRLIEPVTQDGKRELFLKGENRFTASADNYSLIPGMPVAYWISNRMASVFKNRKLSFYCTAQEGLKTADNERFIRFWYEVELNKSNLFSDAKDKKWVKHTKGGQFNRWYGNNDSLLNYENDGQELRNFKKASLTGTENYYKPNITWTRISTGKASFRYTPAGSIPNMAGLSLYTNDLMYFIGLLNSKVIGECLAIMNPTINYPPGTICKLPVIVSDKHAEEVRRLSKQCIDVSKKDYDSFESSWDFLKHPLLLGESSIRESFQIWERECNKRFYYLKSLEERLNNIFIDIYGLDGELTPEVDEREVTVERANIQREIKSLISYSVGCMFGRFSLDVPGIVYAGGKWDTAKYTVFPSDKDAIIPISDDEYFEDDIVSRFVDFVEVAFGKDTLEDNLRFIADNLSGRGSAREVIRNYFINEFYLDHLKTYQKRPIYWLFDSGKKNGFKCLVYIHRYQSDTIARIRTDYVHEQQARYRTAISDIMKRINTATSSERVKLSKRLDVLQSQAEEVRVFEEKIHHFADQMININLDDGIKHNYGIFKEVLAKIK